MTGERLCAECSVDISSKQSNAKFCSRSCKNRASDRRRVGDGRSRARDRARYQKEREHRVDYARSKYWNDPERSREYSREYRKSHPEVRHAQYLARRARKSGTESRAVSAAELNAMKDRQLGECYYCGERSKLVVDHIIPLAKGGRHAIGNLAGACQPCNSSKGAMLLVEWRHFLTRKGVNLTL